MRRYGSKFVYHITVYFLFTLVTVTCKYSTLTQLTYNFASYNSCSNWRPPTSMKHDIGVQDSAALWQISLVCFELYHRQLLFWQLILCPFQLYFLALDWKGRPYSMACEVIWPESPSLFLWEYLNSLVLRPTQCTPRTIPAMPKLVFGDDDVVSVNSPFHQNFVVVETFSSCDV